MKQIACKVKFITPAFLGNAEQIGQWRTPPFKALLRQWWRVAYAAEKQFDFDIQQMRQAEGQLFGHAWLENDKDKSGNKVAARKSLLRIRLDNWEQGKLQSWKPTGSVVHPEVRDKNNQPKSIGSDLYMGYGPLVYKQGTQLKANAAIQSDEQATLKIAVPENHAETIEQAIQLIDLYGAIGGRSRNAWGSLSVQESTIQKQNIARDWRQCLQEEWAHGVGKDEQPLIWRTENFDNWAVLMRELARVKIALRTHFQFNTGRNARNPESRHWLSYPVTNHSVARWGNNARLPNNLRFKVRQDEAGKLYGVIFHMPCKPIREFEPDIAVLEYVWQQVHQFLDSEQTLKRIPV